MDRRISLGVVTGDKPRVLYLAHHRRGGFIGSNLLETLLKLNQRVVGLDNFATGHQRNLAT